VKAFNKKGDKGETSLLFGRRVPKDNPHCEACGTIDEAVSALGIARNVVTEDRVKDIILRVQKELFLIGSELATKPEDYEKLSSHSTPVTDKMGLELEKIINELQAEIEMPESFIVPGSNLGSAWLDLSRTIVRRAERRVVALKEQGELKNEAVLQYLNRLADLLFTLARYEEN